MNFLESNSDEIGILLKVDFALFSRVIFETHIMNNTYTTLCSSLVNVNFSKNCLKSLIAYFVLFILFIYIISLSKY